MAASSLRHKKIAIVGWYGDFNTGGEAMLAAMTDSLDKLAPNIELWSISWNPKLTAKRHGLKAASYFKMLHAIKGAKLVLVGGGTLLTDYGLLPLGYSLLLAFVAFAKMFGKKVMFHAIGAEPIGSKLWRFMTKFTLNKVDLITVRDEGSKRALVNAGVTNPPIYVTVDPAIILQPAGPKRAMEILQQNGVSRTERPLVGICLRSLREKTEAVKLRRVVAQMCDRLAVDFNADVVFIPMSTASYDDDRKLGHSMAALARYGNRVRVLEGEYTPQEIMAVVGQLDLIISMRFHALVFAAVMHVPMIALTGRISYFVPPTDSKILGFLKMVGQERFAINHENLDLTRLLNLTKELWSTRDQIKEELKTGMNELRDRAFLCTKLAYVRLTSG